jgi:ubiquinone/menaquinone biosynthesis C-methylase UbiE
MMLTDTEASGRHRQRPRLEPAVAETRIGTWFIGTEIWAEHVLERAIKDLERLIRPRRASYPVIVDVGCGWGRSFELLAARFAPERMIGLDIDGAMVRAAASRCARQALAVSLAQASAAQIPLPAGSVDMVFCHQTFHHLVDQERAVREFRRILRPGGLLLFAESTRRYIESWLIRLLFRHPMEVQKSADEYIAMVRGAGFDVAPDAISLPYLWWSRADLGLAERLFGRAPPARREETLVNLVAVKPPS